MDWRPSQFEPGSKSKRGKTKTNPKGSGRRKGTVVELNPSETDGFPGPFNAFTLFTLIDGRRLIVRNTPVVVNSTDAERKVRKTKQASLATRRCRARKKKRNPVTKRIDPESFLKSPLPYSVLKEIDAAAFKRLEDNPLDADGRPISFEEARVLAIADFVRAGKKGK